MDMMGIMEKHVESIGKVVSSLSGPATSATNNSTPVNAAAARIDSWEENSSMFAIVEASLMALERAKKLAVGDDSKTPFVEVAKERYEKALSSYREMSSNLFANL